MLGYVEYLLGDVRVQLLDVETGVVHAAFDATDAGLGNPGQSFVTLDSDGSHAVLGWNRFDVRQSHRRGGRADGAAPLPRRGRRDVSGLSPSISADGRVVGFEDLGSECRVVDVSTGARLAVAESIVGQCRPIVSVDGRHVAVETNESVLVTGVNRP